MFDFYQTKILEGDVVRKFESLQHFVGHVQFASVPDRQSPDHGELNYDYVLQRVADLVWMKPIGPVCLPENVANPDLSWSPRTKILRLIPKSLGTNSKWIGNSLLALLAPASWTMVQNRSNHAW